MKYYCPEDYETVLGGGPVRYGEEMYDAGEETVSAMAQQLDLAERDRICYLFDYGDEWRFYAILKEIDQDSPSDKAPEVVTERGDPVEQYRRPSQE